MYLSICQSTYLSVNLHVHLSIHPNVHLLIHPHVYLPIHILFTRQPTYLLIFSVNPPTSTSTNPPIFSTANPYICPILPDNLSNHLHVHLSFHIPVPSVSLHNTTSENPYSCSSAIHLPFHLSITYMSFCPYVYMSACPFVYLATFV